MARDILSGFGRERSNVPVYDSRISGGGNAGEKDVMGYQSPSGPIGIMSTSIGLNGVVLGNRGSQETRNVFGDGAGGMATNGIVKKSQGRY